MKKIGGCVLPFILASSLLALASSHPTVLTLVSHMLHCFKHRDIRASLLTFTWEQNWFFWPRRVDKGKRSQKKLKRSAQRQVHFITEINKSFFGFKDMIYVYIYTKQITIKLLTCLTTISQFSDENANHIKQPPSIMTQPATYIYLIFSSENE